MRTLEQVGNSFTKPILIGNVKGTAKITISFEYDGNVVRS